MYFKGMELVGFKSFCDTTKIDFNQGVTIVVGPNGCGKSNISDGIRWVLGEQSAKHLRGQKMDDVIFNGSATRKQTGYAEVTLLLDNSGGLITRPDLASFPEVSVTRRVYRSGESEYFINKIQCRLKDIVDLFLDTGISAKAFSIIEQGKISQIINSRPIDRRFLIEEVAGVMKYKHRKHAAMNKLNATRQNLLRVDDILSELERQRNSLKRQANKAEKYAELKSELKSVAGDLYAQRYQSGAARLHELDKMLAELQTRETELAAKLGSAQSDIAERKETLTARERELGELKENYYQAKSGLEQTNSQVQTVRHRIETAKANKLRAESESARLEQEHAGIRAETAQLKEEIESLSRQGETLKTDFDTKKGDYRHAAELIRKIQVRLDELARESMAVIDRLNSARNESASCETRIDILHTRKEKLLADRAETARQIEHVSMEISRIEEGVKTAQGSLGDLRNAESAVRQELESLAREQTRILAEIAEIRDAATHNKARLESLRDFERNFEGYGDGVKSVLTLKRENRPEVGGITGLLVDHLRTKPELETAIEAALGDKLQGMLTAEFTAVESTVKLMKQSGFGRGTFIPSSIWQAQAPQPALLAGSAAGKPGVVAPALDSVEYPAEYAPLFARLLGNTVIVENIESAARIWAETPGITVVTRDGDIIDRDGGVTTAGRPAYSAGAQDGDRDSRAEGLMHRKRHIEELERLITESAGQLEEKERNRQDAANRIAEKSAALESLTQSLREAEMNLLHLNKDAQTLADNLARMKNDDSIMTAEIERIDTDRESAGEKLRASFELQSELSSALKSHEDAQSAGRAELESAQSNAHRLAEEANRAEIQLTTLQGKVETILNAVERLTRSAAEITSRKGTLAREAEEADESRAQLEADEKRLEHEGITLTRKLDELEKSVRAKEETVREAADGLATVENSASTLHIELDDVRERSRMDSIARSETAMRTDNVLEKAMEEFGLDRETLAAADISMVDPAVIETRTAELRDSIRRLGDVNTGALEEYTEVNTRYEFMKAQRDDLVTAIDALTKTIEKIDRTTKVMFKETFELVNANFKQVFSRLFNGGRAEMVLVESEDYDEPGVDVIVQPPGKKLQNITLLSAGEKAMTAISLLFAIFLAKPSPFCLLDEVDAPLDEANIERFKSMVKELADKTQFIIITHNQTTMALGDQIYGVTMEEHGVSKILSLNLKDSRREQEQLEPAMAE